MVCRVNACSECSCLSKEQRDAGTDILAMHLPCAPACGLSSTRPLQRYKKACAGRKNKTCSVVWTYSRHTTCPGTDLSGSQQCLAGEEVRTCPPAHMWAICLVSKSRMSLLFTPRHSCLHLALWHRVGSASSTHL